MDNNSYSFYTMKYNKASFYIDTFRIHLTIQSYNMKMSEILRNEVSLAKKSKPTYKLSRFSKAWPT